MVMKQLAQTTQNRIVSLLTLCFSNTPEWPLFEVQINQIFSQNPIDTPDGLKACRKDLLDLTQHFYGDSEHWQFTRRAVLRSLGERGLQGFL